MLKGLLFLLAASLSLTGCEGVSEDVTLRPIEYICASATEALNTANRPAVRAKISDNAAKTISDAVAILDPQCSAASPPTLTPAIRTAMEQALAQLSSAVRAAQ